MDAKYCSGLSHVRHTAKRYLALRVSGAGFMHKGGGHRILGFQGSGFSARGGQMKGRVH